MNKIKTLKKILGVLLLFVITISICFAIPSFSDVKVEAQTTQAQTGAKKKGHDYTGNLNAINKNLDELTGKNKNVFQKNLQNFKNLSYYNDGAGNIIQGFVLLIQGSGDVPTEQICLEIGKAVANILFSAFGLGGVSDVLLSLLDTPADVTMSEVDKLQNHLDQEFDKVNEQLDDIQNEIAEMQNYIDNATMEIVNMITDALEVNDSKNEVLNFMSSKDGNFSYNQFKNYIYGMSNPELNDYDFRQAYYNRLLESIMNKAPEDVIENNYNSLYRSLMSTSQGNSNIIMFYDYLLGNDGSLDNTSIQQHYYNYLADNRESIGDKNAEFEALMFTYDLYNTALFADYCITSCNNYFLLKLVEKHGENLDVFDEYVYGTGDDDRISYGELLNYNEAIKVRQEKLEKQMTVDVAYIFNAAGSVVVTDDKGFNHYMTDFDPETFGHVIEGQTIQMNKIPDEWCEYFNLDKTAFKFEWENEKKEKITNDGIFTVSSEYMSFVGSLYYKDKEVYSISFDANESEKFNGGDGSQEEPYIISNAYQFNTISTIEDGLEKYYILINDIDFTDIYYTPIGDEKKPFIGEINGNGFKIKNINSTSQELAGLFGVIGEKGTVKNLILDSSSFNAVKGDEDLGKLYAGGIASINRGLIWNCTVKNCFISISQNSNRYSDIINNTIHGYTGGVAASNYSEIDGFGEIQYCTVENTSISTSLERHYGAENDNENGLVILSGGVVAEIYGTGKIYMCTVDSRTTIHTDIISKCDKSSKASPYITINTAGIAGSISDADNVKYVISELTEDSFELNYKVDNVNKGQNQKNCEVNRGNWFTIDEKFYDFYLDYNKKYNYSYKDYAESFEVYSNVTKVCKYNESDFEYAYKLMEMEEKNVLLDIWFPNKSEEQYNIEYSFKGELNEKYNCYNNQLYDVTDDSLRYDGLTIKINGQAVDYLIISYYDFDTSNSYTNRTIEKDVIILFSAYYDGSIKYFNFVMPIIVKENTASSLDVSVMPNKLEYEHGEEVSVLGGSFVITYQDGTTTDVTANVQIDADTTKYGKSDVTVTYGEFTTTYKIEVICYHNYNNVVVKPTCATKGYVRHICSICDKTYEDSFTDEIPHQEELINSKVASCSEEGYSGDKVCSVCNVLIEEGIVIKREMHDYRCNDEDGLSHRCSVCGKNEEHEYISVENTGRIFYSCIVCDHETEGEGKIDNNMPRVVISEAYALPGKGNQIVVYVEMLNNPGITGASFSVNYDSRLEFVKWEKGNVLINSIISVNPHADRSACMITMGRAAVDNSSGNLIKLFFKVPDDAKIMDEFDLIISYSKSGARFSDAYNNPIDILTVPGKITIVEHLPGDVNNDEHVDILDAVLVARYLSKYNDTIFNVLYGDVNLDGHVNINDLTRMLQYLVGGYGAKLINNEFKIVLNTNDGKVDFETLLVRFYNEDGTIANFGDISSLDVIERPGYRFDGWYTQLVGGNKIENITKVNYNNNQDKQTLYAHYTLNSVKFDGNGETKGIMNEMTYGNTGDKLIITNDYIKEGTVTFNYQGDSTLNKTERLYYTFLGWALSPNGKVVYSIGDEIDMKNSEIGDITLYAVWSTESVNLLYFNFDKDGYDLKEWAFDEDGVGVAGQVGEQYYPTEKTTTLYACWEAIQYKIIYNGNGATSGNTIDIDEMRSVLKEVSLVPNNFYRKGYHFVGWATEPNGTKQYEDGAKVKYINTEKNGVVNLYAQWKANTYNIVFDLNMPDYAKNSSGAMGVLNCAYDTAVSLPKSTFEVLGWIFKGWSNSPNGNVMFNDKETILNVSEENGYTIKLFAVWTVDPHTVGRNVENDVYVSDTNGENKYKVYNEIDKTPQITCGGKVIVDWTSCPNGDNDYISAVNSTGKRYGGGNNNLDIAWTDEVYFVGNKDSVYTNVFIYIVNYPSGSSVTMHFNNFNIAGSINPYQHPVSLRVTLNCLGSSSVKALSEQIAINGFTDFRLTGNGDITIAGGSGVNGSKGADASVGGNKALSTIKAGNGTNGTDGKVAISCTKFTIDCTGNVLLIGGNGGVGGNGGNITGLSNRDEQPKLPSGGNGGNGGNGGLPINMSSLIVSNCGELTLKYGSGGNGGNGGKGGDAYERTGLKPDHGGNGGNGGKGGNGYVAGNGGNGGKGGFSFGAEVGIFNKNYYGTSGNGGNGGDGGTKIYALSYTIGGVIEKIEPRCGIGGTKGSRGEVDTAGIIGKYGNDGVNGNNGSYSYSLVNDFENLIIYYCEGENGSC